MVLDEHAAAARQDRRAPGETCAILLAPTGGESADPPPVRGHAPPNLGPAGPGGLTDDVDRRLSGEEKAQGRRGVAKMPPRTVASSGFDP